MGAEVQSPTWSIQSLTARPAVGSVETLGDGPHRVVIHATGGEHSAQEQDHFAEQP
jgi:hypothetical protein